MEQANSAMQIQLAISISWLQMGPPINTPADLTTAWQTLRLAHPGLPSELRDPQRDALFWLIQGKSIILCIGTGDCSIEVFDLDNIMNFIRQWQITRCIGEHPDVRHL